MELVKVRLLHNVVLKNDEVGYANHTLSIDKSLANILVASQRAEFVREELPIGTEVKLSRTVEVNLSELNKEEDLKAKGRKRK